MTGARTWQRRLLFNRDGNPRPVLANIMAALTHAPEWRGVLAFDEFRGEVVALKALPWAVGGEPGPWNEQRDCLAANWLQHQGIMAKPADVAQAVDTVARLNPFHCVRDYLDKLKWDGIERIETWLSQFLGAADDEYARAVGPRWLIGAVARILRPGCKVDTVLVLEGPQGARKSSALRTLGGDWFADRLSHLRNKDAAMELRGAWIIEIAELDLGRTEANTVKAFLSRNSDRYRPPYGRRIVEAPRQCIFAGTVNPEGGYLSDPTGGRRFWPVRCGEIDIGGLAEARDQLWAEAKHCFDNGQPWYLETEELHRLAAEQQADRHDADVWLDPISQYLRSPERWPLRDQDAGDAHRVIEGELACVSAAEVLQHGLKVEVGRFTKHDAGRVNRCLTLLGFEPYRPRLSGTGARPYMMRRATLAPRS